ncbi:MAG: hypothetical protein PHD76_13710 [Methylacidiphilales bacterium]|nr:hypothetical protein [Candidatus Methylacidiphilales bacterium]
MKKEIFNELQKKHGTGAGPFRRQDHIANQAGTSSQKGHGYSSQGNSQTSEATWNQSGGFQKRMKHTSHFLLFSLA